MRPFRLPRLSRSFSVRPGLAGSAWTLILALVAGLACDENAPTETRAAAAPEVAATTEEPDALPYDGVLASAIALPVNQSVATTSPAPAFRVNQTGTGPNGIFQISRAANTHIALSGITNGLGRAGTFQIANSTNSQFALGSTTNGTGGAGFFAVLNSVNNQPALLTQTNGPGVALRGLATGGGGAGHFQINNASNSKPALQSQTSGTGPAGLFTSSNTGFGNAVRAQHSGLGSAGRFDLTNVNNLNAAVVAVTAGRGRAGHFESTNAGTSNAATLLVQAGQREDDSFGFAAEFFGNVHVNGTLEKHAGSFKIDHPLDPERKYLSHSFVESPDMKNVYDGTVTLDANGRATVELPDYFEALNRDFRYQLTAIGAPGPNLYIAEGVKQNCFRIAGGRPYARVSWQVTGVRQDTYANEHRIKVEEEKPRIEEELVASY
jgi:hypothetical protein